MPDYSHTGNVPNSNSLIHGGTNYQIVLGVELCRHDIVVVASQNGNASTRLPIPYANGLIVGS